MSWEVYVQAGVALAAVLLLLIVLSMVFRKVQPGAVPRGKSRRLQLVEVLALDPQRRLVLLRRDGAEHLVLTGPQGDLLIEAGLAPAPAVPPAATIEREAVVRRDIRPPARVDPRVERVEPRVEPRIEPRDG